MDAKNLTVQILNEVYEERERQNEKWGEQDHSPQEFLMILGEEVGEANKAALECHFGYDEATWANYRKELIQVAAVAVQMVEAYDKQRGIGLLLDPGHAKGNVEF